MGMDKSEKKKHAKELAEAEAARDVEMGVGKDKSEKKRKAKAEAGRDVETGLEKDKSEKKTPKRKAKELTEEAGQDVDAAPVKKAKKEEIVIPVEDLSPLAHPLAHRKLVKKLHKTIKRASKARQVKRGVKEVVKGIRKGEKGLLVLAGDINPIDIISHLPVLSEEAQIPYVFVASKEELGHASATKRPTSCVMVCPDLKARPKRKDGETAQEEDKEDDYRELYDECYREVEKLDSQVLV